MTVAANRRIWSRSAALLLLAMLPLAGNGTMAAGRHAAADHGQCDTVVRDFLQRAPLMRRPDDEIARLLDEKRYGEAASALRSAMSRYPDAWAGYTLGSLYASGLGVPRSAVNAFHWYLWSARGGDRFAQRQVANAYLDGEGIGRNAAEAAYWFRIGIAPLELVKIYNSLSEKYAKGDVTPVNPGKANYYLNAALTELRQLAGEPNGEAAYYLGLAYEHGKGVPQDRGMAERYLCRAASLRNAAAVTALRRLRESRE